MENSDKIIYIILVIVILVVIYLFWKKHQSEQRVIPSIIPINSIPLAPSQQNIFITLQQSIIHMQRWIIILHQKISDLIKQQLPPNIKTELAHTANTLNHKISLLNTQISTIEKQINSSQLSKLDKLLSEFNEKIVKFNQLIYPLINIKIISLQVPSIPIAPIQPSPIIPQPLTPISPSHSIDCESYRTSEGNYCLGREYQDQFGNVKLCYRIGSDQNNGWQECIGNIICDPSEPNCREIINICGNKPSCNYVNSLCNLENVDKL